MKKIILLTAALMILFMPDGKAQFNKWISYQTVVRDNAGKLMSGKNVTFKISILKTSAGGSVVYSETHVTATTALGLVNLEIGNGSAQTGSFINIAWGADKYFLQVELDATGGGYVPMGTTEILNVPRALYAEKVGTIAENQVGDTQIQDMSRSFTVPAGSLSFNPASSYISISGRGLTFKSTYSALCCGLVSIPADWDGISDITIDVLFSGTTPTLLSGNACFFLRVTGRNSGDNLTDPGSTSSSAVNVTGGNFMKLYKQTFTVPVANIAGKEFLHFYSIQRGGTGETCTDDLELLAVRINYNAKR